MFGSNENKNKLIEWKSKKQELRSTKPEASFPERWIKKKNKEIVTENSSNQEKEADIQM